MKFIDSCMKTILNVGDIFGDWKVLKFDCVDKVRARRYICECKCGVQRSLKAAELANGRTKRCRKCKASNLTNKIFGEWLVLQRAGNKCEGKAAWICQCSCGKTATVIGNNLVRKISTCCYDCGHNVLDRPKVIPLSWWNKTANQAKSRGLVWKLSEKYVLEVLEQQKHKCALSGLTISFENKITASIDRIDSKIGYEKGNVQWVHTHINMMKFKYDQKYFIDMCKAVAANN